MTYQNDPRGSDWAAWSPVSEAFGPAVLAQPEAPARAKTRTWPAVVAASLLSATLAAGGTAIALGGSPDTAAPASTSDAVAAVPAANGTSASVQEVAAQVAPSVVALTVISARGGSVGSGVIISSDGSILTNDHVVAGASTVTVTLADGRLYDAELVGTDPTTDLAVVRIVNPPRDLAVARLGHSDQLAVGQEVLAIGNPLGLSSTVTSGIISALDRPVVTGGSGERPVVTNAIQVDAAVNPGNSGGPLFALDGSVVGITSSIASTSQKAGSIGLGFAIPADVATRVATEIIESGSASHAFLGVGLTNGEATAGGTTRSGALVMQVTDGSAAEAGGLQVEDVVVGIDGVTVTGADSLTGAVRALAPGQEVTLDVVRAGSLLKVQLTLGMAA